MSAIWRDDPAPPRATECVPSAPRARKRPASRRRRRLAPARVLAALCRCLVAGLQSSLLLWWASYLIRTFAHYLNHP